TRWWRGVSASHGGTKRLDTRQGRKDPARPRLIVLRDRESDRRPLPPGETTTRKGVGHGDDEGTGRYRCEGAQARYGGDRQQGRIRNGHAGRGRRGGRGAGGWSAGR